MRNLIYYIVYGIFALFSLLPMWVHYLISDVMYVIVYYLVGYRKKLVRKNLRDSFPEKSTEELLAIEKAFYQWFCDYLVETIKLLTISKKEIKRRMVFKGAEIVDEIVASGQSCAMYLGHYCNWEWISTMPLWVSSRCQCGQIYHVLENSIFDRLFLHLRQRMGAVCIPMAETLRRIATYRQQQIPVVIGYISDQVPFWNNIHHWIDFLNHDTPVLTGTERLVRSAGHAVLYFDVKRIRRGYYETEIKLIQRDPKQTKDYELTDAAFRLLEDSIRTAPQYWLWTHNRWKRTREEYNLRYDETTGRVDITSTVEELKAKKGL
ncbi:MAG: lysophospholipid acyltransferase family protein [Prevotella sp.]|nr:lysophospholipid acyltransferase family protein [Prevotella sp.]